MTTRAKIIIVSIAILAAFATGRFTVPEKVRIETKYVKVEKKTEKTVTDKDTKKKTVIHEVTHPDGKKEKITEIVEESESTTKKNTKEKIAEKNESSKEVTRGDSKVTVSVLSAISTSGGLPDFGLAITKPVLGPITIGIFGFRSALVGASLGLTF